MVVMEEGYMVLAAALAVGLDGFANRGIGAAVGIGI